MIRDARALRDEFVPQELQHRNSEIDHISSSLRPIEQDLKGEHTLITGPSGAGKTTLAKYVCQQLERQTLGVRTGYVNCLSANTATGVIHMLLRDSRVGHDFSRESTARSQYFQRIRNTDGQLVFIVDEVDVLDGYEALLSLFDQQNVTLVMICIDEEMGGVLFWAFGSQGYDRDGTQAALETAAGNSDGLALAGRAGGETDE